MRFGACGRVALRALAESGWKGGGFRTAADPRDGFDGTRDVSGGFGRTACAFVQDAEIHRLDERLARSFKTLKYIDCCAIALKLGDLRLANTVMVGALSGWLGLPESSWQAAVERSVKTGLVENNMAALKAGQEA